MPKPRLLFIDEIGNGVDNVRWYPTKLGRDWEITETLRPLEPFRDQVTVLSGLRQTFDDLFQKLFVAPTGAAVREAEACQSRNESILDGLEAQTESLRKAISAEDARQVEAYLDAVREMDRQIARDRDWLHKAPPDVDKAAFVAAESWASSRGSTCSSPKKRRPSARCSSRC